MWIHDFTVTGTYDFPLDMLRYDSCHPLRGEDVAELADSLDREARHNRFHPPEGVQRGKPYEVRLRRHGSTKFDAERVEAGRWNSFMWAVMQGSTETRKI